MDDISDLAIDSSRLPVEHKDSFIGGGNHVGAEDARTGDGSVGVPPLGPPGIDGPTYASDHLHFAVLKVHQQDVLLVGRTCV